MKRMTWMVAVVFGVVLAGCEGGSDASTGRYALTPAELQARLAEAPRRVEITLRADGSVREVELEDEGPGHAEQLAGRVVARDGDVIKVAFLGAVDLASVSRWRTRAESSVSKAAWLAAVDAGLASGEAVWIEARGAFGPDGFVARDVRIEDRARTRLEVDGARLADGVIVVGDLRFALEGAALRRDDGDDDGLGHDVGDDHGDDGAGHDVGDDHGDDGPGHDVGDDHGGDGPEAGDDDGDDGPEAGDDNGDDGPEAGDDDGGAGDDGPEASDDNGDDGPEAGDDNGDDGPEAGDDDGGAGDDGPEAGDDDGDDGPEAGDDDGGPDDEAEDEAEDGADDDAGDDRRGRG